MKKLFNNCSKKSQQSTKTVKAFTLIELLIVIAVIGILMAVILPNLIGMRERARDTAKKNDLTQLKKALRLYFDDHQGYPPRTSEKICCGASPPTCGSACGFNFAVGGETYMKALPDGYKYWVASDRYSFRLAIELENASDKDIAISRQRCPVVPGFSYTSNTYVVCED